MTPKCQSAGATHIGGRDKNEDKFVVLLDGRLVLVADGMGGHEAGEVASGMVVESLSRQVQGLALDGADFNAEVFLKAALDVANAEVYAAKQADALLHKMGSTATVACVVGRTLHVVWAGDSRVYVLRKGALIQVNDDHVLNYELYLLGRMTREQMRAAGSSNVITRYVGGKSCQAVYTSFPLEDGDVVLTCSDGLSNTLKDAQMVEHLWGLDRSAVEPNGLSLDVSTAALTLVQAAVDLKARDNVTAVVTTVELAEEEVEDSITNTQLRFPMSRFDEEQQLAERYTVKRVTSALTLVAVGFFSLFAGALAGVVSRQLVLPIWAAGILTALAVSILARLAQLCLCDSGDEFNLWASNWRTVMVVSFACASVYWVLLLFPG